MARTNFLIYFSSRRMLDALRDDQLGRVIRAAMNYAEYGTEPCGLDQAELVTYESLRGAIQRDIEKYEEKCARLRENGTKGGRPKTEKNKNQIGKNGQNTPETPKPNQGATSTSTTTSTTTAAVATRACAREDAPDGAPLPLPDPERFFLENGFARRLSPFVQQQLNAYRAAGMEDALLLHAMQEAANNGSGWVYARAVLERCLADGIKTTTENEQHRRPKANGHNVPVTRAEPSGRDFLSAAATRPRRLKRKD